MQVKKFEAPTLQEALDSVKKELGPEAIILHTKQNKKAFGLMNKPSVEVTAAVSDRSLQKKKFVEAKLDDNTRGKFSAVSAGQQAAVLEKAMDRHIDATQKKKEAIAAMNATFSKRKITATRYVDIEDDLDGEAPTRQEQINRAAFSPPPQIRTEAPKSIASAMPTNVLDEISRLKQMVSELHSERELPQNTFQSPTPSSNFAYETLVLNGIEKRFAHELVSRAVNSLPNAEQENLDAIQDQIASLILDDVKVSRIFDQKSEAATGCSVIALIGPTGVGKTTTLAKIASVAALQKNLKVALINLDLYRVAAVDQLSTYAKIMNLPFRSATSAEELKAALQDFSTRDLVLVDTTGRSQKDLRALQEMRDLLQTIPGVRTQLVLSATTRDAELLETGKRFQIFNPESVVFSKLDEAISYGSIYNFQKRTKLPYAFFATGQRVPEDIEEATPERVASLALDL